MLGSTSNTRRRLLLVVLLLVLGGGGEATVTDGQNPGSEFWAAVTADTFFAELLQERGEEHAMTCAPEHKAGKHSVTRQVLFCKANTLLQGKPFFYKATPDSLIVK